MIKGIIFDLDGVICSTDEYHYQAWKKLADEYGIYFDEKINDQLRGVSRMQSLEIILQNSDKSFSEEEKIKMAETKNNYYVSLLEKMSEKDLDIEVKETLDYLRNKEYLLAIGSSSKNAKKILKQIGMLDYFDAISDGNNIKKSKPDPEVFIKAAQYLNIDTDKCLVVEDAHAGILAAKAGGFLAAGINQAKNDKDADYSLSSFKDLMNIL